MTAADIEDPSARIPTLASHSFEPSALEELACVQEHDAFVVLESEGLQAKHDKAVKSGKAKRKKLLKTHTFFSDTLNTARQQYLFALVTEDIPLNSTAGIQNIGRRLWSGRAFEHVTSVLFMLGQLTLNIIMVIYAVLVAHGLLGIHDGSLDSRSHTLKICSERFKKVDCIETKLAWMGIWRVLLTFECVIVMTMVTFMLVISLWMLCSRDPARVAAHHHFALMALPRIACKFSLIIFLHLANSERAKDFIFRGEFRCLATVFRSSLFRASKRSRSFASTFGKRSSRVTHAPTASSVDSGSRSSVHSGKSEVATTSESRIGDLRFWDFLGVVVCGVLILLSLQVLLLKLTIVYFAGLFAMWEWTYTEWMLLGGFLNQLGALSMSGEVEMLRILLFKFGGEESKWNSESIDACETYFHYLAYRSVEQLGPLKGMAVMWNLTSGHLQNLLQGHMRLNEQKAVRDQEVNMFQRLHDRSELEKMRDDLLNDFQQQQESMYDRLLAAPVDQRLDCCNAIQTHSIGELRLAAKTQEFIWEWDKVLLLEAGCKDVSEEFLRRGPCSMVSLVD